MYTINTRMEKSFDLDINNYTPDDLISFFKLEKNYSLEKLIQREQDLSNEILSITNSELVFIASLLAHAYINN